jgi:hypothetical protein
VKNLSWILVFILLIISVGEGATIMYFLRQGKVTNSLQISATPTVASFIGPSSSPTPTSKIKTGVINKKFSIPINDSANTRVGEIDYFLKDYEKRGEISVQGKSATAVSGRAFLVINLEVTNDLDRAIEVNTRDYIRLLKNKEDILYAPDVHNDPVEIQPSSTEETRVGFAVDDADRDFVLQIGETEGQKELLVLY